MNIIILGKMACLNQKTQIIITVLTIKGNKLTCIGKNNPRKSVPLLTYSPVRHQLMDNLIPFFVPYEMSFYKNSIYLIGFGFFTTSAISETGLKILILLHSPSSWYLASVINAELPSRSFFLISFHCLYSHPSIVRIL